MLSFRMPKLEDSDPELIPERTIFAILKEYLQPTSATTPTAAAKAIDQFLPAKRPDFGVKVEPVDAFVPNLWDLFMDIARQIPSDHESQDRLVKLVDALRQLPSTVENIWGGEALVWADLPLIGPEMREFADSPLYMPPLYNDTIPPPEKASAYINLSSYAARLLGSQFRVAWFWMPLYEFRCGLETQPWREMHAARLNCYVSVYAEWMRHSGESLFRRFQGKNSEGDGLKGPLYTGVCYSEERWVYWERCLGDIHENGEGLVAGKTRELAGEVKKMMEHARENTVPWSDDDEDEDEDDSEEELAGEAVSTSSQGEPEG